MNNTVEATIKELPKSLDKSFFVKKAQVCPECERILPLVPEVKCRNCNSTINLKQEINE